MDSQVAHAQGQGYEQDPNALGLHSVVEGGDNEHHHEKKSVLKKVKAKAKKLKDTITKHGHGHGHPEGHVPDDHDLDEEDDQEEEVVEDPEIHGAPVYESLAIVSSVDAGRTVGTGEDRGTPTDARREEKFGRPRVNLGSTRPAEEVLLRAPANTPQSAAPTRDPGTTQLSDPTRTFVHGMGEAERGRPTVNLARPGRLEEDPQSPRSRREPSNYQTKVTDPTASGGEEADVSPVVRSLGKMTVQDETGPEKGTAQSLPAETQAHFSNIPTGTGSHRQFSPESTSIETDTALTGVDVTKPKADPRDQTEHKPSSPRSYTEKLSSATSVIAEKAVSAKNLVALKLGNSERESLKSSEATGSETHSQGEKPSDQSSYTGKVSAGTSAIADKAMLAKNIVVAKLGYGEKGDTTISHNTGGTNSEPRAQEATAASGKPPEQSSYTRAISSCEKPSDQSSYTGKVSSGTSAVAEKAMLAKNIVAAKLGYSEKGDTTTSHNTGGTNSEPQAHETNAASGKPPEQSSYTRAISSCEKPSDQSSYTGKVSSGTSAVADKAMLAKNIVSVKLGYGEKGDTTTSHYTGGTNSEPQAHETNAASGKPLEQSSYTGAISSCEKPSDKSSYTGKVSSSTSAVADKAMLAKNIVAAKLGYSEKGDTTTSHYTGGTNSEPQAHESNTASGKPPEQSSYTGAISSCEKPSDQSSYTGKVSSGTSANADNGMLAKNIVAAKLGYSEKGNTTTSHNTGGTNSKPQAHETTTANSNQNRVQGGEESNVSPVIRSLGKMTVHDETGPKSRTDQSLPAETCTDISNMHTGTSDIHTGTGSQDQFSPEPTSMETDSTSVGVDVTKPDVDPRDQTEHKPLSPSSYIEKLSSSSRNTGGTNSEPRAHETTAASGKPPEQSSYTGAISAIADKAISAKDTVASKLGYAKKEGETETLGPGGNQPEKEQGKGVAATVTEKLSPVISKVTGLMTGQRAVAPGEVAGAQVQDKGVSVRDYLAEKLTPGEEDKALSEVISSALHKKKTAAEAEAATAVKVTESAEVKKQLAEEGDGQLNSPEKRMVDKLRGTVGSWFSKTDESKASQQPASHDESEAVSSAAGEQHGGERIRQESTD